MISVYKLELDGTYLICETLDPILEEIRQMEEDTEYTVSKFKMSYEELEALDEFDGF